MNHKLLKKCKKNGLKIDEFRTHQKGYCNQGFFMLNVSEILNNKASSSSTYIVVSSDVWHGRLGHVSFSYIKKMVELSLIPKLSLENLGKCEVCVESKTTKKSCKPIERKSELLILIHSDLGDLKNTMTRGDKRFYITFIDDYSRYTRVYLLRNKDEAMDAFIKYKNEVENQLSKKIKRLRSDKGGEYESNPFNTFCEEHGINMKPLLLIPLNLMEYLKESIEP